MKKITLILALIAKMAMAGSIYDIELKRCKLDGSSTHLKALEFSVTTGRSPDFNGMFGVDGGTITNDGEKFFIGFGMNKPSSQPQGQLIINDSLPIWTINKDPSGGKLVLDLKTNKGTLSYKQYSGYGKVHLELEINEKISCQNI